MALRKRTVIGGIFLAALLLGASPFAVRCYFSRQLSKRVEELTAANEPLDRKTLVAQRAAQPPPPNDATAAWLAAFELIDEDYKSDADELRDSLSDNETENWTADDKAAVAAFLEENAPLRKRLFAAVNAGGSARLPADDWEYLDTSICRNVIRLLDYQAFIAGERGAGDACCRAIDALLAFGLAIEDFPCTITASVRRDVDRNAFRRLSQFAARLSFSDEQLRRVQILIRSADPILSLRNGVKVKRIDGVAKYSDQDHCDIYFKALEFRDSLLGTNDAFTPQEQFFWKFSKPRDMLVYLNWSTEVLELVGEPWPDCLERARQLDEELESKRKPTFLGRPLLLCHFLNSAEGAFAGVAADLLRHRAFDALIAAELYRRATGEFPASWDDLTPEHLPSTPIDPFDGQALRFRLDTQGFVVYRVNQTDGEPNGDGLYRLERE